MKNETFASLNLKKRLSPLQYELLRKALHILSLIIPAGMLWLGKSPAVLILGTAAAFAVGLDILRSRFNLVNKWILFVFGSLMRPGEKKPPGGKIVLNGATNALISAFLLILIFPVHVAALSFTLFMVGDGAAAVVGQLLGKRYWGRTGKTVEGSLAFLIAALVVAVLMPGVKIWIGAAASVLACLLEALPGPFNDNLRVPLATAGVMFLLMQI